MKKKNYRGGVRLKNPEQELLASLGLMGYGLEDVFIPENAEAIGYDTVVQNDGFGNYTETQVVYFTNRDHTEEMGDLEYFDSHEDAMDFGEKAGIAFGLPFVGRYDADDASRAETPRLDQNNFYAQQMDAIDAQPDSSMDRNDPMFAEDDD